MNAKSEIDVCLTCTRTRCTGSCARLRNSGEAPKKPRRVYTAKRFEYQGEQLTLNEISARCGIDYTTLYLRIVAKGWTMERATTEPVHKRMTRVVEAFGEAHTLREWATIRGLPLNVNKSRISSGWTAERALTQPITVPRAITVDGEQITAVALARRLNITEALVHYRVRRGWTGDMIVEHYRGGK